MSGNEDEAYGPPMPPGFGQQESVSNITKYSDSINDQCSPLSEKQKRSESKRKSSHHKSHHSKKKRRRYSSDDSESSDSSSSSSDSDSSDPSPEDHKPSHNFTTSGEFIGPMIPTGSHRAADDEIGPSPSLMASGDENYAAKMIESRAEQMKDRLMGHTSEKDMPKVREDWMMTLPDVGKKEYDLVNRTFQQKPKTELGDRSGWTDTPEDKLRKDKELEENPDKMSKKVEAKALTARDKYLTEQVDEYNKKARGKSLLQMHQKKKKKKEKKEKKKKKKKHKEKGKEAIPTRVPFDRDNDLKIDKRLTNKQKGSIISNSQKLNSRFSHGGNKFL